MAVEKPAGISVHNAPGTDVCSLVRTYLDGAPQSIMREGYAPEFGVHPVHRLDQETSGVILLACQPDAFRHLAAQFKSHTVRKRYVAILHGEPADPGNGDGWGDWSWKLTKAAGGRKNPAGSGKRLPSRTRYRVLRRTAHYTVAECEPETGRKHQIRRHAKLAGHAVAGDKRYGTERSVRFLRETCGFDRLGLHSLSLVIVSPATGREVVIQSPGLPSEMAALIDIDGGDGPME